MGRRKKKPRKNYRKGTKGKRTFAFLRRLTMGLYVIAGIAALVVTSCLFVLVHDVITQCDYFNARSMKIEGGQHLSPKQIVAVARVKKGTNIIAANLAMARKRLLAHPWVAEAQVRREIPSGLHIIVHEHKPLAIVELDRKYLINQKGQIFKELTSGDPVNLPLISGLDSSDIGWADTSAQSDLRQSPSDGFGKKPFEAVMRVLLMSEKARGLLSNRHIKEIQVDREIGITLKVFKQMKTVVLGYHNYPLKFRMFKNILAYGRQRRSFPDFDRIDLNNVNRIVVRPVIKIPSGDHKEV